jgi:hypothetical protein
MKFQKLASAIALAICGMPRHREVMYVQTDEFAIAGRSNW